MPRILQTGTYNSMNKGDAAMQISTPFPDIDCGFYKHYELIKCSRWCLLWASFQLLRAMLWGLTNRFAPQLSWLIPERELQEYVEADLVVDLSGDMLTEG